MISLASFFLKISRYFLNGCPAQVSRQRPVFGQVYRIPQSLPRKKNTFFGAGQKRRPAPKCAELHPGGMESVRKVGRRPPPGRAVGEGLRTTNAHKARAISWPTFFIWTKARMCRRDPSPPCMIECTSWKRTVWPVSPGQTRSLVRIDIPGNKRQYPFSRLTRRSTRDGR